MSVVNTTTTTMVEEGERSIGLPMDESPRVSIDRGRAQPQRPQVLDFSTPSMEAQVSRSPSPISNSSTGNVMPSPENLEERVKELEEKLATLSLMLSQQRPLRVPTLQITPPQSPTRSTPSSEGVAAANGVFPALDSPAPLRPSPISDRKRNLSYQILHGDSPSPPDLKMGGRRSSFKNIFMPTALPGYKTSRLTGMIPSIPSVVNELKDEEVKDFDFSDGKDEDKKDIRGKWLDYLNSFQQSNYDVDVQMEEFVKIPSAVESLLGFGFWICVDSFLYVLTVLPIRFVWSSLLFLRYTFLWAWKGDIPEGPFRFHRRHSYQLIQVSIIYSIYRFVLLPVSIGKLYHWIRGQEMVKLYVVIAMLEVFDRLLSSLGQDCLESLYWNTTRRPRSSRLLVSVLVVLLYTGIHSFLLFVHVATLNVAMNSDDQALLSLLMGGNFAEIKSTVFKKYNKATLFKIAASDICERFKLALFLLLVLTLNFSQGGMDRKMVSNYFHMCGIVWAAEWLADWIKHSFITKFNYISSGIYPEYGLLIAGDFAGIGHEGVNMDHSHAVVKRLGLAQMPLVIVLARYTKEAFKYATYENQPANWKIVLGFFTSWLFLLMCKQILGGVLQGISLRKLKSAPEFCSNNAKVAQKKNM